MALLRTMSILHYQGIIFLSNTRRQPTVAGMLFPLLEASTIRDAVSLESEGTCKLCDDIRWWRALAPSNKGAV